MAIAAIRPSDVDDSVLLVNRLTSGLLAGAVVPWFI